VHHTIIILPTVAPQTRTPIQYTLHTPPLFVPNFRHSITHSQDFSSPNQYEALSSPTKSPAPHPHRICKSNQQPKPSYKLRTQTAQTAINVDSGVLCKYHQLLESTKGSVCLPTHGIPITEGTNTIAFIPITNLPKGQKATYPRIVVANRHQKQQPRRLRVTVGGDQIHYPHDVSTKASSLATVKLMLNSTISTPNSRFMCDKNPMSQSEYMRVPIASILPKSLIPTT
jgi:hypothetical protein